MQEVYWMLAGCCMVMVVYLYATNQKRTVEAPKGATVTSQPRVITQAALEELVQKAANQKYLETVLNQPLLPLPKKPLPLQPPTHLVPPGPITSPTAAAKNPHLTPVVQRCTYNDQTFVVGDIIKREQAWFRCTPTVVFSADAPGAQPTSRPAWVAVH